MAVTALKAVYQWVMRTMMKSKGETGIVRTLPNKDLIELNTQITAQRLMQNGIDPTQLKNPNQVENAIIAIESRPTVQQGITSTKSADVFDLKGKKIKDTDNIMAGEELPPPGSRGGADDIAAPVQSSEETLKNMIMAENKKNIAKIKQRKKMLDDAIEDASPGFSGDRKVDAELVAENLAERRGLVYDDLPTKERLKIYDEAFTGLSKKKDIPDDFATGGRVGLKNGSILEQAAQQAGNLFFPEGDLQNIKATAPDQRTYNIEATRDMVENLPGGLLKDIVAPAGALVMSPFYDAGQALTRMKPGSGIAGFAEALDLENPLSSAYERFVGAAGPLADRFNTQQTPIDPTGRNLFTQFYEDDPFAGIEGQTAGLGVISAIKGPLAKIFGPEVASFLIKRGKDKARSEVGKKIVKPTIDKVIRKKKKITGGGGRDTGGGGGYTPTTTAQNVARTESRVDSSGNVKAYGLKDGGRIGYKLGSIDKARRAFLKATAGIGGGIAALKTGLLGLGKEAAPMVEAAKETVTQAPSYFFDLVTKIKLLGTQRRTPSYRERVNEYQYTGKDGNEYLLTEELDTGDIMIQKDKLGVRNYGDESYEVIEDRTEMVFRKGQADETTKGTPADDYEEYKVEFDQDGTAADATDIDELSKKEIIKEVTDEAPSIKKASGGIARMLGE